MCLSDRNLAIAQVCYDRARQKSAVSERFIVSVVQHEQLNAQSHRDNEGSDPQKMRRQYETPSSMTSAEASLYSITNADPSNICTICHVHACPCQTQCKQMQIDADAHAIEKFHTLWRCSSSVAISWVSRL